MTESIGQTLGPIVYGSLLLLGYRQGILVFGITMGAALLAFLALSSGAGLRKEA